MMPRAPLRRPLRWPVLAVTLALACAWRALAPPPEADGPALALIGFLIGLGSWILTGLEIAGKFLLQAVVYSVHLLWAFAVAVKNGFIEFAGGAVKVFRNAFKLTRLLYTDVVKPFALKFWKFIDSVQRTLQRVLKPIFKFLYFVRSELLKFYDRWMRPVLDIIGHVRATLRVLASLHLEFARKLDAKLAQLEELIDRPFRLVLRKLNEVINIVNRVVTADGLFQRLALIRSLERDLKFTWRVLVNGRSKPLTDDDFEGLRKAANKHTFEQVLRDTEKGIVQRDGPNAAFIGEMNAQWRIYLRR